MRWAAVTSGLFGLVADVFLVLFYIVARPWTDAPADTWLGEANDYLIILQYVALLPVVLLLGSPRTWTVVGTVACLAVVILQAFLVTGLMSFDIQVGLVSAASIASMIWAGVVGLPLGGAIRTLSRVLLLGLPVAVVAFLIGTLVTIVAHVQWAWVVGGVAGVALWFVFPVWSLVLGRTVLASTPQRRPVPDSSV